MCGSRVVLCARARGIIFARAAAVVTNAIKDALLAAARPSAGEAGR